MLSTSFRNKIQSTVLLATFLITVVVSPGINSDPINLPKLLVLGSFGIALLGNLIFHFRTLYVTHLKLVFVFATLFVTTLAIAFFASDKDKWTQFFGVYGRNTGFLAYLSLVMLLVSSSIVGKVDFAKKLVWILIITGGINTAYGLIQWSGNDPVKWSNPFNPIVGTLGNPNFISAHLGIASLAALAIVLDKSQQITTRLLLVVFIAGAIFTISKSDSTQGFLIFLLVATLHFYLRFLRNRRLWIRIFYFFLVISGSVLGVIGILQKGPLSSILYQDSVTYRGDYWRAGMNMTLEKPLFGFGLDSYGDWYRTFRTEIASLRRGPDVVADSAHNVFLDISSNGGLLLLLTYLLILGLVLRSAVRLLKHNVEFDSISVGLVGSWLAYLLQSTISINQLGIAVWGWVLGGGIIGYDYHRSRIEVDLISPKNLLRGKQLSNTKVVSFFFTFVVGLLISIWPLEKDASFVSAIDSSSGIALEKAADKFPRSSYHYIYLSQILLSNNYQERALEMSRRAIKINPRDFNAWKSLIANPLLSVSDRRNATIKMKRLDPFNNTLDD